MVATLLKKVIGVCPICGKDADTTHHKRPISDGGSNDRRNKVKLCHSCHDIVEEIYQETNLIYSPALVRAIKIKYDFPLPTSVHSRRFIKISPKKRHVLLRDEKNIKHEVKKRIPKRPNCINVTNFVNRRLTQNDVSALTIRLPHLKKNTFQALQSRFLIVRKAKPGYYYFEKCK